MGKLPSVNVRIGKDTLYIEVSPNTPEEIAEFDLELAGELEYFIHFAPKPANSWLLYTENAR